MSTIDLVIKGGQLPDGRKADIAIAGEHIVDVSDAFTGQASKSIDAKGCIVLPGLVDLHTHLREPGREDAETVLSGSRAGAKGGFTALSAMANTSPVADTAGVVEQVYRLGQEAGLLDVFPIGAVSQGLEGKTLSEIGAMADSVAQVRVFSDDGHCVSDPLVMRRALEYIKKFGGVIAQHAQDPRMTVGSQMNEGAVSSRLGLKGWPAVAEEAIIARDVLLADHVQSRLHICHLTTAGGVEIIRWAKARGINVTAEVTPHHLLPSALCARRPSHPRVCQMPSGNMPGSNSMSFEGYDFVLIMQNIVSRYVSAVARKTKESAAVVVAIKKYLFRLFGVPTRMLSYQGKEVSGLEVAVLLSSNEIKKETTTPYHPK